MAPKSFGCLVTIQNGFIYKYLKSRLQVHGTQEANSVKTDDAMKGNKQLILPWPCDCVTQSMALWHRQRDTRYVTATLGNNAKESPSGYNVLFCQNCQTVNVLRDVWHCWRKSTQNRAAEDGSFACTAKDPTKAFIERAFANFRDKNVVLVFFPKSLRKHT